MESGISVSYKADPNVNAKIVAEYKKAKKENESTIDFVTVKNIEGGDCIEFEPNLEGEVILKEFEKFNTDIKTDEYILVHFVVTNQNQTSDVSLNVVIDNQESENMMVKYCLTNSGTAEDWKNSLNDLIGIETIIEKDSKFEINKG